MNSLTRRDFLAMAGGISLALAAPSFAWAEGGSLEDIKKRGQLTVGTEAAYEPYEFVENGQIVGYGHDILVYMSGKLGVSLNQINLPFQGLLPGLLAHKFDFVATSVGVNPERAKRFAYSRPLGVSNVLFVVRSNDAKIRTPDDIAGHIVGTQMGSAVQPEAQAFDAKLKTTKGAGFTELKLFQAFPDVMVALSNKTIDVAVMPSNIVSVIQRKQPGQFTTIGELDRPRPLCWVANANDKEIRSFINESLDELTKDGQLAQFQRKWFGQTLDLPTSGYLPEGAV